MSDEPIEPTTVEPTEDVPSENSDDMIDRANAAAERLETANKERARLLNEERALKVERTLGGKTSAAVPKKELTEEEYARKVMANDL